MPWMQHKDGGEPREVADGPSVDVMKKQGFRLCDEPKAKGDSGKSAKPKAKGENGAASDI